MPLAERNKMRVWIIFIALLLIGVSYLIAIGVDPSKYHLSEWMGLLSLLFGGCLTWILRQSDHKHQTELQRRDHDAASQIERLKADLVRDQEMYREERDDLRSKKSSQLDTVASIRSDFDVLFLNLERILLRRDDSACRLSAEARQRITSMNTHFGRIRHLIGFDMCAYLDDWLSAIDSVVATCGSAFNADARWHWCGSLSPEELWNQVCKPNRDRMDAHLKKLLSEWSQL
jgi:hypothetical protein